MTDATDTRGQTLHDFAIGMAVFLLVLGYVFAFVPSLFAPFTPETDSTAIRVDRTADTLTRDVLVENESDSRAGVLNETCTDEFFVISPPSGFCRFDDPNDIHDITALPSQTNVNVTMMRNGTIANHPETSTRLARGPSIEGAGGRVIRATRVVTLDGRDFQFVVRIW